MAHPSQLDNMQTITDRASKAEIISAAVELTDLQAQTIQRLREQQAALAVCLALALIWGLL
jgi:hypothetical protein